MSKSTCKYYQVMSHCVNISLWATVAEKTSPMSNYKLQNISMTLEAVLQHD